MIFMRKRICTIFVIFCAFLFASCENPNTENAASNLNKTGNQNISSGGGNAANNPANENSNTKTNAESNTNGTADFEGTAGITDKKNGIKGVAVLREVRTAQHDVYDRAVFEFEGAEMPSYHIEYIDKPVRACGSGNVVNLKGDGWLEIRFEPANAHTEDGKPTVENRELSPNHKIINELKLTCDFEAVVTWVLGVSSPNKYRILELENPTRLAVDIKH
jgi:hypothetical protein